MLGTGVQLAKRNTLLPYRENEPLNEGASDTTKITLTSSSIREDQPIPTQTPPPSPNSSITQSTCVAEPHAIDGAGSPGSAISCGLSDGGGPAGLAAGVSGESQQCGKTPDVPCRAPTVGSDSLDSGSVERGPMEVTVRDADPAARTDQLRSEPRALTRPALGQTTILGLFASRNKELQKMTTEQPPPPPTPQAPSPDPTPTPGPKLSSADDFLSVEGEGAAAGEDPGQGRELTGGERSC